MLINTIRLKSEKENCVSVNARVNGTHAIIDCTTYVLVVFETELERLDFDRLRTKN